MILRASTCEVVAQLLSVHGALPVSTACDMLLQLDLGCSLLQARVVQCLSRKLAAVSEGLAGQLPPDVAAVQLETRKEQEAERGQEQRQQQRGREPNADARTTRPLRAAQSVTLMTHFLMTQLSRLMSAVFNAYG